MDARLPFLGFALLLGASSTACGSGGSDHASSGTTGTGGSGSTTSSTGTGGSGTTTSSTGSGTTSTTSATECAAATMNNCVLGATNSGGTSGTCAAGYNGSCSYACSQGTWTETTDTCAPAPCAAQTAGACILGATNSGGTSGACAGGYTGSCSYACNAGTWTETSDTCAPAPCAAQTAGNCVLGATNSGGVSGTCAGGYAGSCSYACSLGAWTLANNTCAPASCAAATMSNCELGAANSGGISGTCASGYTGSCSYSCNMGTWTQATDTCTPAPCAAQTAGDCVLGATNSGGSSGTCAGGYTGSCSYACSLGTWTLTTDGCAPAPCAATTMNNCVLGATNSGGSSGTCAGGTMGSCSYACSLGTWTQTTNTCVPTSCAATTMNGCVLGTTNSGGSSGSCQSGDGGSCSYSCNNGTWTQVSNTCGPLGSSAATAGASCQALLAGGVTQSGIYWINPGGGGAQNAFQAYCNQTDVGGGWTLILHTWDSGTYPPTAAFAQSFAAWQTSGIGSASGYTGPMSSTFYVMPLAQMQTLISATASSLRFQSDKNLALATLTGLTMNASYGFGGTNTASVASTMCGSQATSNCFLLAPGFSSYDVDHSAGNLCGTYVSMYYANVGYWYDDCYSTNVFATGGTYGGPMYYASFTGDPTTSHWTWWVQ